MSLNKFLCLVGICFSPELCDFDNSNVIYVENNQAAKSHLGDAISTLATDMNQVTDVEDVLVKAINCMPCNEASKHLEKLQKVLFSYISLKYKPTTQTPVTCPIGKLFCC
jgi:TnpA family transposase